MYKQHRNGVFVFHYVRNVTPVDEANYFPSDLYAQVNALIEYNPLSKRLFYNHYLVGIAFILFFSMYYWIRRQ